MSTVDHLNYLAISLYNFVSEVVDVVDDALVACRFSFAVAIVAVAAAVVAIDYL